ncbi:MAG: histidine kinase [Candidatus Methanosuratincola sp.]
MSNRTGFRENITISILKWRWAFVALIVFVTLTFQFKAQRINSESILDLRLLAVVIPYAFFIPLLIGILLSIEYDRSRLQNTVQDLHIQQVLIRQLANARDWEELTAILLQFPRTTFPLIGASLYLYNEKTGEYRLIAGWSQNGIALPEASPSRIKTYCSVYQKLHEPGECVILPCCCLVYPPTSQPVIDYCIPLVTGDREVAMLHLFLPKGEVISPERADLLAGIAPEAALAIERTYLKSAIETQSRSASDLQDHFARYLHDTLGHNVAYMRLKLDQLLGEDALRDTGELRREINRLLNVANQTYEQVRGTLVELRRESPSDLSKALLETATKIGERAKFLVDLVVEGEANLLPDYIQRHILYIARESLMNIEKHASAKFVKIVMIRENGNVRLDISDDGVGFDPSSVENVEGHYGLKLMKECATELAGNLEIISAFGAGTHITLTIPTSQTLPS